MIDRGQILVGILGTILIIIAWRLPPEQLASTVTLILENLLSGVLLGYVLFVLAIVGWGAHYVSRRRLYVKENKRLASEKQRLQKVIDANLSKGD